MCLKGPEVLLERQQPHHQGKACQCCCCCLSSCLTSQIYFNYNNNNNNNYYYYYYDLYYCYYYYYLYNWWQVQVKPWCLRDANFVMKRNAPSNPQRTIFVGGVPRPLKAGQWHHQQKAHFTPNKPTSHTSPALQSQHPHKNKQTTLHTTKPSFKTSQTASDKLTTRTPPPEHHHPHTTINTTHPNKLYTLQ